MGLCRYIIFLAFTLILPGRILLSAPPVISASEQLKNKEAALVGAYVLKANNRLADFFSELTGWPRDKIEVVLTPHDGLRIVPTLDNKNDPSKLIIKYSPDDLLDRKNDSDLAGSLLHEYYHEVSTNKLDEVAARLESAAAKKLNQQTRSHLGIGNRDEIRQKLQSQFAIGTEFYSDVEAVRRMLRLGYDPESLREYYKTKLGMDEFIAQNYFLSKHPQTKDRLVAIEATIEFAKNNKVLFNYDRKPIPTDKTHLSRISAATQIFERRLGEFHKTQEYRDLVATHVRDAINAGRELAWAKQIKNIDELLNTPATERDPKYLPGDIARPLNVPTVLFPGLYATPEAIQLVDSVIGKEFNRAQKRYRTQIRDEIQRILLVPQKNQDPFEVLAMTRARLRRLEQIDSPTMDTDFNLTLTELRTLISPIINTTRDKIASLTAATNPSDCLTRSEEEIDFFMRNKPGFKSFLAHSWPEFSPERRNLLRTILISDFNDDRPLYKPLYPALIAADPIILLNTMWTLPANWIDSENQESFNRSINQALRNLTPEEFKANPFDSAAFISFIRKQKLSLDSDLTAIQNQLGEAHPSTTFEAFKTYPELRNFLKPAVARASKQLEQRYQGYNKLPKTERNGARADFVRDYGIYLRARPHLGGIPESDHLEQTVREAVSSRQQAMLEMDDESFSKMAAKLLPLILASNMERAESLGTFSSSDVYLEDTPEYENALALLGSTTRNPKLRKRIREHGEDILVDYLLAPGIFDAPKFGERFFELTQRVLDKKTALRILERYVSRAGDKFSFYEFQKIIPFDLDIDSIESLKLTPENRFSIYSNSRLTSPEAVQFCTKMVDELAARMRRGELKPFEFLQLAGEFASKVKEKTYWEEEIRSTALQHLGQRVKITWQRELSKLEKSKSLNQVYETLKDFTEHGKTSAGRKIQVTGVDGGTYIQWSPIGSGVRLGGSQLPLQDIHRNSTIPLFEKALATADLEAKISYLIEVPPTWRTPGFFEKTRQEFLNSDLTFEKKVACTMLFTGGNTERMDEFWKKVIEPARKNLPYDAEVLATDLKTVYHAFHDARFRKLNQVAHQFRLNPTQIEDLENRCFPDKAKALFYKEIQLYQAAVKKLMIQTHVDPLELVETIRWFQGKREATPPFLGNTWRIFLNELPKQLQKTVAANGPDVLRRIYQSNPLPIRIAMLEDFINPYDPNGLWHPDNVNGKAVLKRSLMEGLGKSHEHLARLLFDSYTQALDKRERGHLFIAQLVASQVETGEEKTDAEILKSFFEAKGGLWIKIGQLLASDPELIPDEAARRSLQKLNDQAAEPLRKEIYKMLEEALGTEYSKIKSVELILGSGSINVSAVVEFHDGRKWVARMVKGDPDNQAQFERDDILETAKILKERAEKGDSGVSPALIRQIAGAMEEYVVLLTDSMKHEADLTHDRTIFKDVLNAKKGSTPYSGHYSDLGVSVRLVGEGESGIVYAEKKANPSRIILFPVIDDVRKDLNAPLTAAEDLRAKKAMLRMELEGIFTHGRFDPDGHSGNWLVTRDPVNRRQLVIHRIDTSQALVLPVAEKDAFTQLVSGLSRHTEPGLVTVSKLSDAALVDHMTTLIQSTLPKGELKSLIESVWKDLSVEGHRENPVKLLAQWKSRIRDRIPAGQSFQFSIGIQMALKSLFLTQQLLDISIPKQKSFIQNEFMRVALNQGRFQTLASGLGVLVEHRLNPKLEKNQSVKKSERIDFIRQSISESGRQEVDLFELDKLLETHPQLKPQLIFFGRRLLKDNSNLLGDVKENIFDFLRREDVGFAEFVPSLFGQNQLALMAIDHTLSRRDTLLFDVTFQFLLKDASNFSYWMNDRAHSSKEWRAYIAKKIEQDEIPIALLQKLDSSLYPKAAKKSEDARLSSSSPKLNAPKESETPKRIELLEGRYLIVTDREARLFQGKASGQIELSIFLVTNPIGNSVLKGIAAGEVERDPRNADKLLRAISHAKHLPNHYMASNSKFLYQAATLALDRPFTNEEWLGLKTLASTHEIRDAEILRRAVIRQNPEALSRQSLSIVNRIADRLSIPRPAAWVELKQSGMYQSLLEFSSGQSQPKKIRVTMKELIILDQISDQKLASVEPNLNRIKQFLSIRDHFEDMVSLFHWDSPETKDFFTHHLPETLQKLNLSTMGPAHDSIRAVISKNCGKIFSGL